MRAHPETLSPVSPSRVHPLATPQRPTLLVLADPADVERYRSAAFSSQVSYSATEAIERLRRDPPAVLLVDWDTQSRAPDACVAAPDRTSILALLGTPEQAPAALRAGCHGLLLKPVTPSLLAARLGRLGRERAPFPGAGRHSPIGDHGTNRRWSRTRCPSCDAGGAISFDFSSRRRAWYACLACDAVWLGPRQE
jgi:DNA-binding NarL/FixJ family response regulator